MSTAPQVRTVDQAEVRNVAVDLRGKLDEGELLVGTPTVTEVTSTDLTISNNTINSDAETIMGLVVPAGQAVLFRVSGFIPGAVYRIKIHATTDASPAQTLIEHITIKTDV